MNPVRRLPMSPSSLRFAFPDPREADEEGYLVSGGRLNSRTLETAYKLGIFPWPYRSWGREIVAWYSPDPRAILPFDGFHLPKRVARRIRSGCYVVRANHDFPAVIRACAEVRPNQTDSWITPKMIRAYSQLHEYGNCHSVEVYREDTLVGGVYGIAFGGYFSAESMFHRETDCSKIALAHLVRWLGDSGFSLLDIQQPSATLTKLGAITIPREEFLTRLYRCVNDDVKFEPDVCG